MQTSISLANFRSTKVIWCLILAFFSLIATLFSWSDLLYYDAEKLAIGEYWRPFTAWIVQANISHWAINLWGLVIMGIVLPNQPGRTTFLAFAGVWIFASLCLMFSDYAAYVGLSGVLYGWLFWSIAMSPFYRPTLKVIVLGLISAKVVIENSPLPWLKDSAVSTWVGHDIAYESHLWGLLGGVMTLALYCLFRRFQSNAAHHG
ncbi:rhombosortase [Reinekea forsetii]|nr:rhombosortase [Reinekea forsetii]